MFKQEFCLIRTNKFLELTSRFASRKQMACSHGSNPEINSSNRIHRESLKPQNKFLDISDWKYDIPLNVRRPLLFSRLLPFIFARCGKYAALDCPYIRRYFRSNIRRVIHAVFCFPPSRVIFSTERSRALRQTHAWNLHIHMCVRSALERRYDNGTFARGIFIAYSAMLFFCALSDGNSRAIAIEPKPHGQLAQLFKDR